MGRENRLYQADWLMRLYGYSLEEVIRPEQPYLDLQTDPKLGFAQRQPGLFPVDINSAEYDMILRVPGIGLRSAKRIVRLRRQGLIRYEHLRQMGVALNRAVHFIVCPGQPVLRRAVKDKEDRPVGVADLPRRKLSVAVPSTSDRQLVFLTDGTFEGLLTAVFEAYAGRTDPAQIRSRKVHRPGLFEEGVGIPSDARKAARVWQGLNRHLGSDSRSQLYQAYRTGEPEVEILIYRSIRTAVPAGADGGGGHDPAIRLAIERLSQKVLREAHRKKGLVRFSRMENDLYLALVNPRYDILPLIRRHFEQRYADQRWVIFDGDIGSTCRRRVKKHKSPSGRSILRNCSGYSKDSCSLFWGGR